MSRKIKEKHWKLRKLSNFFMTPMTKMTIVLVHLLITKEQKKMTTNKTNTATTNVMQKDKEEEEEEVESIDEESGEETLKPTIYRKIPRTMTNKNHISIAEQRKQLTRKLTRQHPALKQWYHQVY